MALKLTDEEIERLKNRQLANIIAKLNAGKTLTAAENAMLSDSSEGRFAGNWDALGKALGVTRRTLHNWRHDPRYRDDCPKDHGADGRKEIAAWRAFMQRHQLKGSDDEQHVDDDVIPVPPIAGTASDWHKAVAHIEYERAKDKLETARGTLLVAAELEIPLGATFVAIAQRLAQFPERAARHVTGLRNVQEVIDILRAEIECDITELHGAQYLQLTVEAVVADLPCEPALRPLIAAAAEEAVRRIGRAAIAGAINPHGADNRCVPGSRE